MRERSQLKHHAASGGSVESVSSKAIWCCRISPVNGRAIDISAGVKDHVKQRNAAVRATRKCMKYSFSPRAAASWRQFEDHTAGRSSEGTTGRVAAHVRYAVKISAGIERHAAIR